MLGFAPQNMLAGLWASYFQFAALCSSRLCVYLYAYAYACKPCVHIIIYAYECMHVHNYACMCICICMHTYSRSIEVLAFNVPINSSVPEFLTNFIYSPDS